MEEVSHFFNFFTKLLYGTHLSLAFSGITLKENKKGYWNLIILVSLLQNISYLFFGEDFTIQIYPFLIHIPIIFVLHKKNNIPFYHSIFSLILAFQLLSCREWVGSFFNQLTFNTLICLNFSIIFFSLPLAFLISKYLAPPIAQLQKEPKLMLIVSIIPLTYYVFTMLLFIWEIFDLANIEYITPLLNYVDIWFTLIFIIYTLISLRIFEKIKNADIERAVLLRMQNHAEIELKQLHRQSEIEKMYQHDLRHHGNYLLSLLPCDIDENIVEYIKSVMINPKDYQSVLSNNESLNLILNFYKKQSDNFEIDFEIKIGIEEYSGISMIDLCSLLSNGLENAVKSCRDCEKNNRKIYLKIKTQGQTLLIDLRNSFSKEPIFVNDLPITLEEKHGYGTKSMLSICEKYNGITRFYVADKEFRFQTIIQNKNNIE